MRLQTALAGVGSSVKRSKATRKMNKDIDKIFKQLEAHGGGSGFGGGGVWVF